jgi:hypothetical protein
MIKRKNNEMLEETMKKLEWQAIRKWFRHLIKRFNESIK